MWRSKVRFAIFTVLLIRGVFAELQGTPGTLLSDLVRLGDDLIRQDGISRVEFWFFKASDINSNFESLLEKLVAAKPFSLYPKLLHDEFGSLQEEMLGIATLVLMFFGENQQCGSGMLLHKIDTQSRLVIILPYISPDQTKHLMRCFRNNHLFNVFYVIVLKESNHHAYLNYVVFRDLIQNFDRYESIDQAFPQQSNLVGQTATACLHPSEIWTDLDAELANLVINRMNGSLRIMTVICQPGESIASCNHRRFQPEACSFSVGRWILLPTKKGAPVIPMYSLVVLVPNGIPLTEYELLLSPYSKSCWAFVLSIIVLHALLMRTVWRQSSIESLLLTVCELNGSSLTRQTPIAKLVTIAAILLAFIILSAYEAKITSYISNWPHKSSIRSLEELRESNIKILVEENSASLQKDHWLQELLVPMDIATLVATAKTTSHMPILLERYTARLFIRSSTFFDGVANRPRYVMLEESVYSTVAFYKFGYRNTLLSRFTQIQNRIYESGIDQVWMDLIVALRVAQNQFDAAPKMIQLKQLQHLNSILFSLWFCSFLVFLLELGYARIKKFLTRWYLHRNIGVKPRARALTYPFVKHSGFKKIGRKSI